MADYAAEIEVWSDGKAEREEITNYDEVQNSIPSQRYLYPEGATKAVKGVFRKRAKTFQLVDGVLHYKENNDAFSTDYKADPRYQIYVPHMEIELFRNI